MLHLCYAVVHEKVVTIYGPKTPVYLASTQLQFGLDSNLIYKKTPDNESSDASYNT